MSGTIAMVAFQHITREALNKSFDKLRTNGNFLIPFVVSLSNHNRNPLNQCFPSSSKGVVIQWLQNPISLSDRTWREMPENSDNTVALSNLQECSNQFEIASERACRRNKNTSDVRGFN